MIVLTAYYGGEKFIVNPRALARASASPEDPRATRLTFLGGEIITAAECFDIVAGKLGAE